MEENFIPTAIVMMFFVASWVIMHPKELLEALAFKAGSIIDSITCWAYVIASVVLIQYVAKIIIK